LKFGLRVCPSRRVVAMMQMGVHEILGYQISGVDILDNAMTQSTDAVCSKDHGKVSA